MADRAGESVTANYGWVKPNPGASDDVWGGQLNTDLDAIDAKMFEIDGRPSSSGEITADSTPTSGFEAGQILMSDGATVQAMTYGATMNFGSAAAPLMVSSEAGTPGLLTFTAQQSGYPTAFGIGMRLPGAFTGAGSFGFHLSYGGYFGLNNLSNWMNGLPDFAMVSDANEAGRGDFRSISDPSQPLDLRVYNTYTSYVVGEWGGFDWKTVPNTLTIGTNAAGGGVLRPVNIVGSTVTVNGSAIPAPSSTTPAMDGTAAPGVATTFARGDHVHPKDTSKLPLTGGTLSGNLIIGDGSGSAYLGFNTASGANYSAFSGQVLGTNRWNINLTGVPTETGTGNTGSDFNIIPYTDTGAQLSPALTIKRSSGLATVVADPITPLGVATKQYVDAHGGINDNKLINGDMRIDQRNNGASGTAANVYTVDRWVFGANLATHGTWGRNIGSLATAPGFPYYLGFAPNGAYAPAASDYFVLYQGIEADMVSDFAWGTVSAQPVTLSFWAFSSTTGVFSGAICNYASTRSYPFTFSIPSINVWTKITITIPGDSTGAWVMSGNAGSMQIFFDLGSGSVKRGPANAWASASYFSATGAVIPLAVNAYLMVTGVKLEVGSVATPFNRQSLAKSMADCQRYYAITSVHAIGYAPVTGQYISATGPLPVSMRATPTLLNLSSMSADVNVSSFSVDTAYNNSFRAYATGTSVATTAFDRLISASAEL